MKTEKATRQFGAAALIVMVGWAALAHAEAPEDRNLALGKPYTLNGLPSKTWESLVVKKTGAIPDYLRILTDGETQETPYFWSSEKCVSLSEAPAAITIDLGAVYPIGEIATRHGSRAPMVLQPRKEIYYVSDDGVEFSKVATFINPEDPQKWDGTEAALKSHFSGVMRFSSGPIRAKGRYVMVRTVPPGRGRYGGYVGFDEVFVARGNFTPESGIVDTQDVYVEDLGGFEDERVLGYRFLPRDWLAITSENPLYMALAPYELVGDNSFHLSVGGTYVLFFDVLLSVTEPPTDAELVCEFPADLEVVSWHNEHEIIEKRAFDREGRAYVSHRLRLHEDFYSHYRGHPYFIIASPRAEASPDIGTVRYRYSYTIGDRRYEAKGGGCKLVLAERIEGTRPRQTVAGFWPPYQTRHIHDLGPVLKRMFSFYRDLGFNWVIGGQGGPEVYEAGKAHGFTVMSSGAPVLNGMMLRGIDTATEDLFQYHETAKKHRAGYIGAGTCPTVLCSGKYTDALKGAIRRKLADTDHFYSNWEPYMFLKQGCVCDRCKQAFRRHSGMVQKEVDRLWPDIVTDDASDAHNRFSSYQYGEVIGLVQRATTEVGKEMGLDYKPVFAVAYEPAYVDPEHRWSRVHSHADFYDDVDLAIMWRYHNTTSTTKMRVPQRGFAGNNLPIVESFDNAMRVIDEVGREVNGERLPNLLFMPTEYYARNLVMPRDYYYISLLEFFYGLKGYCTWCSAFKQDARYLALHARANRIISECEDIVRAGTPMEGLEARIVSPVPDVGRDLIFSKGYLHGDEALVAIGNDYFRRITVELKVPGLPAGEFRLVDVVSRRFYGETEDAGFSADDLAQGVWVQVAGKEWAAHRVVTASAMQDSGFTVMLDRQVRAEAVRDSAELEAHARTAERY